MLGSWSEIGRCWWRGRPIYARRSPNWASCSPEETGHEVVFDFGSSGQLAQRIIEGAPVDVFASANISFVDRVLDSGRGDPATQSDLRLRQDHHLVAHRCMGWLEQSSRTWPVTKPSSSWRSPTPNTPPTDSPPSRRSKLRVCGTLQNRSSCTARNVSDTQRLAANGDADASIVAFSLALAAGDDGEWVLIDEGLHAPLEQALVVVADDPERVVAARAFAEFVNSPAGREVMVAYGFVLPGETMAGN
jgi:molybdate transport system substrate-binding protein